MVMRMMECLVLLLLLLLLAGIVGNCSCKKSFVFCHLRVGGERKKIKKKKKLQTFFWGGENKKENVDVALLFVSRW